ncbi:MAG TPA: hypothetical protein HA257_00615 [Candidatus Methanoperedenaceae archaeon]|nr:hypothetical protein [Candidatus Methanoperedenaceae archaeon]
MHVRKLVHISGALLPQACIIFGTRPVLAAVILLFLSFLAAEIARPVLPRGLLLLFWREKELGHFAVEPFLYYLSVITLLFLSEIVPATAYAAIAILAVGDGFAGVFGKKCGRHRLQLNGNKSWEGTLSGFLLASAAGYYYAGIIAIAGSFSGMLAEALSDRFDNITVPFAALAAMLLIGWLM